MGGGLPPMAVFQLQNHQLVNRYRGQAPSHILFIINLAIAFAI
ncbi:hypothetical protein C4J94_2406 [Pseudomonas sp. R5-89-07]|nr:hypothetical protein C4J94_2406 [Pseudomonas sp. R5-89-07]